MKLARLALGWLVVLALALPADSATGAQRDSNANPDPNVNRSTLRVGSHTGPTTPGTSGKSFSPP